MKLVIQAAMAEEIDSILNLSEHTPAWEYGNATAWSGQIGEHQVTFVRSGIGLVNAAVATTAVCQRVEPDLIIAAGTCGGLGNEVHVGDQIVGDTHVYNGADATLFGYALGQIPGMPPTYAGAPRVLSAVSRLEQAGTATQKTVVGQVLSGDSFIEHTSVTRIRALFPQAIATDMESCAIAQAATSLGIPFASVRTVSDMCNWTQAEAEAADSEFISLQATQPHQQATSSGSRREHVYQLAAKQLSDLLQYL